MLPCNKIRNPMMKKSEPVENLTNVVKNIQAQPALHVVTFATDESRLVYLKQSCKNSGLEITIIMKPSWNGYQDKILYIKEFLQNIPETDIVCFVDAYDVLGLSDKDEILKKFYSFNCELVIGAELNCYPGQNKQQYPQLEYSTNYNYVNSGGYIGYKRAISKMFNWKPLNDVLSMCSDESGTDQNYVTLYYISNYLTDNILLDRECNIFQNMHLVDWNEIYFRNGRVVNKILDKTPCFLHFNGGVFWNHDRTINIMPVIIEKLQDTRNNSNVLNLKQYSQLITETCFPNSQIDTGE